MKVSMNKKDKILKFIFGSNSFIWFLILLLFIQIQSIAQQPKENIQNKYSPSLSKKITHLDKFSKFIIVTKNIDSVFNLFKEDKIAIISINIPTNSIIINCNTKFVKSLINNKNVIFIDEYISPKSEVNIIGYNRSFNGINQLDYLIPNANGKNIVAGIKEQKMEPTDLDLHKRILPSTLEATKVENHATVIASIIGGSGNSFYDGRGLANACKFYGSNFANLFADDFTILNQNKVSVQNHSYGTIVQQFYGAEALSYDIQTWQNKNMVHVFSAGNRGTSLATDGKYANIPGLANLTGNFKMAKNVITVGAIDNTDNIPAESSAGPIYDGRLAPQIIALGPNGTSDAAAVVTGTIAVMQQVYADSNSQQLPAASLIKAVLYNTADDVFTTGIDYKTGYGQVNSFAAVKTIQQKKYDGGIINHNQLWTKNLTVPTNSKQLKITLAYTDSAAAINNAKALMNDIDIELIELSSGIIYKPWVLNPAAYQDSLVKLPLRKRDSLNTAEQISINMPNAGNYLINVIGKNIVTTNLPFHIAYNIDTLNTFSFTNPQHSSDVNRTKNNVLNIKWKTFVADTNTTAKLLISYNRGSSFEQLAQLKLFTNNYKWQIKDTTSSAILKMETSFGAFLSKEFIISKVLRPQVDFICADSFRLSWNKHIYAIDYKIFALTDSPFLKNISTTTDTFKVFNRTTFPTLVYAVEPVLTNNIPASRSIAFDISFQGINCFYKALNYNLLDGNKLDLILELSVAGYVDSVYFEEVMANGQLLQTYGGQRVSSSIILTQPVNQLKKGFTFFRGRIKLKSGAFVYTDIIDVLTSGKQSILFYPNPISKNKSLQYIIQQGIPSDVQFQLFDINGRMILNYKSIPKTINLTKVNTGIYIYKIMKNNKQLETGKIVVL